MATANQFLDQWRETLENILQYYANIPYRYGEVISYVIVSRNRNHFMLMHEGWENDRRMHGCIVHAEIRNYGRRSLASFADAGSDRKIWIHYDGIEDGITDELVAAGVPKDCIVLAFHPPHLRKHTGYAIA